MVSGRRLLASLLLLAALSGSALAGEILYIHGARVLPASGPALDDASIVVRDGKIAEVGKGVARPPFSRAIDASGQTITPGFVVPVTRMPTTALPPPPPGEGLRLDVKPDAKAADEVAFRHPSLEALLLHGITTAGVPPQGRDPGIPGLLAALSTRGGTRTEVLLSDDAALAVVAATPEPWRKAAREAFASADEKRHARQEAERRKRKPEGEPGAVERCLLKKKPVMLIAPAPATLASAADSMPLERLDVSVLDGTDLWWEAARVKSLGLRVITYPSLIRQRGTRFPINRSSEWANAGVPVAFALPEDSPFGASRLRDSVIGMVRAGLSADLALKALTSEPAAALGLAEQVGSIQKGRRADLLFWSGDPFEPATRLLRVMSGGDFVARPEIASVTP